MASAMVKFSIILMIVDVCFADFVTEECLNCICQTTSGCRHSLRCGKRACGLFWITEPYWTDGGKHTVNEASADSPNAFSDCAIDPHCAARTVQGYMRKFAHDCNGDGQVDCYDYLAIHSLGGYACGGNLRLDYVSVFKQCMASVAAQQN